MAARGSNHKVPLTAAGALGGALTAAGAAVLTQRESRRWRSARRRFRMRAGQPTGPELQRVLDGRLEAAIEESKRAGHDRTRAVHEMRKSIKRLRTALRVAGAALDDGVRERENASLRAAGRRLSQVRDAAALSDATDALLARHPDAIEADESDRLSERVAALRGAADATLEAPGNALGDVAARLREARERLHAQDLAPDDGIAVMLGGLRRVYRRGRAATSRAREEPSDENLHALRKRAKDLRYGAELLRDADPKGLRKVRRQARDLSELLGDDHDLALLHEIARDCPSVLAAVGHDRARLQSKAFKLAKKLYASPPRRFLRKARQRKTSSSD